MATLVLVPGSTGAGILHESDTLVVFGVSASRPELTSLLEAYRFANIIVNHGVIIGMSTKQIVEGITDGFYQANVFYLKD